MPAVVGAFGAPSLLGRAGCRPLLDATTCEQLEAKVRALLESLDDVTVADLHLWELGPGRRGCVVALVTSKPREARAYPQAILAELPLAHLTVEVHACRHSEHDPDERCATSSLNAA